MAKFIGLVGYVDTVDKGDGVWETEPVAERRYRGDLIKDNRRWTPGESVNDSLTMSNSISILADQYAYAHAFAIRYVEIAGAFWSVTSVEIKRPRLILTVGGVYNGPTLGSSEDS